MARLHFGGLRPPENCIPLRSFPVPSVLRRVSMKRNGRATVARVPRVTFQSESLEVTVPDWVLDLESFRRWADSDDFSEKDRVCWMGGEVLIDLSKEQLFTHGQVKLAVGARLFDLSADE